MLEGDTLKKMNGRAGAKGRMGMCCKRESRALATSSYSGVGCCQVNLAELEN